MIGVGCVDIQAKEKEYVNRVLDSGLITCGPIMDKFENDFAKRHGRRWGLMLNSGTDALRVAVASIGEIDGWPADAEVIVPALTFIATSNIVIQHGLTPVFVDVERDTFNIDPQKIREAITEKTRAIIVVHLFGLPCDMDPIMQIAKAFGLRVIEDSCEAMAVNYQGKPVGSFGDIACFSTYAAHVITTGVGGLAITDDPMLSDVMRSYANHGRDPVFLGFRDSKVLNPTQYTTEKAASDVINARFRFQRFGYSSRATQLEAALGLAQLERIDAIVERRQTNFAHLQTYLKNTPGLRLQAWPNDREHASMMFPIVLSDGIDRHAYMLALEQKGVETRPFFNILGQSPYIELMGDIEADYPVAKELSRAGFYIGCHQTLSTNDLWQMAQCVKEIAKVAA